MPLSFSSLPLRYQAKIEPEPMSGCWLWSGAWSGVYGQVWDGRRREWAHRAVYEILCGGAQGLDLDHRCRVTCCVNPGHLRPGSARDNLLAPGSLSVAKMHHEKVACVKGHLFNEENTYTRPDGGGRQCRACKVSTKAAYVARQKEAR